MAVRTDLAILACQTLEPLPLDHASKQDLQTSHPFETERKLPETHFGHGPLCAAGPWHLHNGPLMVNTQPRKKGAICQDSGLNGAQLSDAISAVEKAGATWLQRCSLR